MKLAIKNNVTKKEYEFQVDDIGDSTLFYHFNITLEAGVDDGEYGYILYDDEDVVATGLLQVGDYTPSTTAYTNDNKDVYIQYNGAI